MVSDPPLLGLSPFRTARFARRSVGGHADWPRFYRRSATGLAARGFSVVSRQLNQKIGGCQVQRPCPRAACRSPERHAGRLRLAGLIMYFSGWSVQAPKPLRFCFYCAAGDGLFIKHSTALFFFQSANALLWFPHQRTGMQIDISAFLLSFSENFDADLTNANDCVMILKPIRRTEKIKSEHWERTCIYP